MQTPRRHADRPSESPGGLSALFERLLVAARDAYGADTVGEAIAHDMKAVATALGIAGSLDDLPIDLVTVRSGVCDELADNVDELLGCISKTERIILEDRIFSGDTPRTLGDIGMEFGLSRERVRQLEKRLWHTVDSMTGRYRAVAASVVRLRLGPVVSDEDFDLSIRRAFTDRGAASDLGVRMVKSALGFAAVNGVHLDAEAQDVVAAMRGAATRLADSVGIIDQQSLKQQLPDHWLRYWPLLVRACGFHAVLGQLALRDTDKALVKAAVIRIGRPATREEIGREASMDPVKVSSQLSGIPGIARADMRRWGLVDWIEDVYEGIPAEIMQRIDEDRGATPLRRLLDELPSLFGVSEASVRAYVGTHQFILRDGYVSLAHPSTFKFRRLDDVIHGRNPDGAPYWEFTVEDRHFDGYSVLGLPPEVVRELGCGANESKRIPLSEPEGCQPLSVTWRMSSTTGASLGYLAEPLQAMAAGAGQVVRLVILGRDAVALRMADSGRSSRRDTDDNHDRATELLTRMMDRRRVI